MSRKDGVNKIVANAKNAASEVTHRVVAKAEELKREAGKRAMKPTDNLRSIANQAKNEVQADIDRAKRDIRNTDEE
jgi:ElaB/YqjD/DUF883 family membrane-anchored ribosome-binding protein